MKSYHNDPAIKTKYLARVKAHRLADELVKGKYWEGGKGCAVGCTVHSGNHSAYEKELGIPQKLARLEDGIFESLPNDKAMEWPEAFLEAVHVGSDLSSVADQFLHWLLVDPIDGVIKFAKTERTKSAIMAVGKLYERRLSRDEPTYKEWKAANADATAAAYAATTAAAYAADADAAADAATTAAEAAADAANPYAYAAAYSATTAAANAANADANADRTSVRKRQAEKLLELLQQSKP